VEQYITEKITIQRIKFLAPSQFRQEILTWCNENGYRPIIDQPFLGQWPKVDAGQRYIVAERED
jgi:hypothetical protein